MKNIFLGIMLAIFTTFSIAHADDLSERKAVMKSINGYMKILRGQKNDFSGETVAKQGENLIIAMQKTQKLFVEKGTGETTALDTIWSNPEGFSKALMNSIAAAENLKKSGEADDAAMFGDAFNQLAQSCGGCHRNFRAKR